MKKLIAMLVCIFTLISVFSVSVMADASISPRYNNVAFKDSYFEIANDGTATVRATYSGDDDIITGATIKIKIQKQFLFFFWTDVVEWIDESNDSYHTFVHSIQVDSGTYKATIEYTIRGTGGDPDVITDTIERSH